MKPKQVFSAETLEDAEKMVADKIDEKYQKSVMDIIRKAKEKKKDPNVTTFNFTRTEESNQTDKVIIILKTATSTLIVPVLMHSAGNIDISLEISKQGNEVVLPKIPLSVESDIESHEGLMPLLVIPHQSEGNDNGASISQILGYFLQSFSGNVCVTDFGPFGDNVTGQIVTITAVG